MKPMTVLLTAALLSISSISACSNSENSMSIQQETEAKFHLNPQPKQAYRLKIKINDAPGPLKLMGKMGVGYKAEDCTYIINKIEGAPAHPEKNVQFDIHQINEFEYESIIYADAVLNEDYFGNGVCHWNPEGFGFSLSATGKPEETRFNFSDILEKLLNKKSLTQYFSTRPYPFSKKEDGTINIDDPTHYGITPSELYNPDQDKEKFSITVSLEEIQP